MVINLAYNERVIESREVDIFNDVMYKGNEVWYSILTKTYKENFGIDISTYPIYRLRQDEFSIVLDLYDYDFIEWRNRRLNKIGLKD